MNVQSKMPKRRSQEERKAEAEQALLDAASELFAEQGISNTSLAQIGERAGYSRGLVNHHFGSKSALIDRLTARAQNRSFRHIEEQTHKDARHTILALVDDYISTHETQPKEIRAFLVMWGAAFPEETDVSGFKEADLRARANLERVIRAGQKDGSINKKLNPSATSVLILGLMRGVASQALIADDGLKPDQLRKQCRLFVASALT